MHADPRWCLKQTRKTVTMTSVGQTRWRTLMMSLEKYIGGCKVVPLNILDKCKIKMWIVVAHNQFNYFYWRWATLTTTSHLQEESLSQRTLRAMMTMWETQPNISIFLLLKLMYYSYYKYYYYSYRPITNISIPIIADSPRLMIAFQRSLPSRDSIEVLCVDVTMTVLTVQWYFWILNWCCSHHFSSLIICCRLGTVYHATHLPWQSGHSDLL